MGFCVSRLKSALVVLALTSSIAWAADLPNETIGTPPAFNSDEAATAVDDEAAATVERDVDLTSAWPGDAIRVKLGYSTLLKADLVPTTIVVGNEEVVEVAPVGNMLILTGKTLGSTNLYLLDEEKTVILATVIDVVPVVAPLPVVRVFEGGKEPLEYACGENVCTLVEEADAGAVGAVTPEFGPCMYPDDIAADGSRCGDRAASVRPGGVDGEGLPE